jgi:hypothetical protein
MAIIEALEALERNVALSIPKLAAVLPRVGVRLVPMLRLTVVSIRSLEAGVLDVSHREFLDLDAALVHVEDPD